MRSAAWIAAVLGALALAAPASAVTVTVDTLVDETTNAGTTSLREALEQVNANNNGIEDIISITPQGTSTLTAPLPASDERVRIDGPALSNGLPTFWIDGNDAAAGARVLYLDQGSNSAVNDIGIFNFDGIGLDVDVTSTLANVVVGMTPTGTLDGGQLGLEHSGSSSQVTNGLFAGNVDGVFVSGRGINLVNSVIGGNSRHGVVYGASNPGVANVLSGSFVGVRGDGTTPFGNGVAGLNITQDNVDLIAGRFAGLFNPNVIAFNGGPGIANPDGGIRNFFGVNSIFGNGGLPIDLGAPGLNGNDPLDADTGPNDLQNHPFMQFARFNQLQGQLHSKPNQQYFLDFYRADASGGPRELLGGMDGTTDGAGNLPFTFTLPTSLPDGVPIVGITGGPLGMSEFSPAFFTGPATVGGGGGGPTGGALPPEDPSFTRFRDLGLQSFRSSLSRQLREQSLALSLSGRTLRTWTDYRGLDPEVNNNRGTTYEVRQEMYDALGRYIFAGVTLDFRRSAYQRRPRPRRTTITKRFTSLPRGRRILFAYRIRRANRRVPAVPRRLRLRIRQRFTITRPGFRPLVVNRTRNVTVRRRRGR
jgi:hypothetical protein